MFRLTPYPIIAPPLEAPTAGGFVDFEGKVRNNDAGRPVIALVYEAYDEMAISEGEKLIREATERFGLSGVAVTHRTGRLEVGEAAVLIQVAAPHRREAFAGCEWLIDQLKWRVPIWKQEIYADGEGEWIGAGTKAGDEEAYAEFTKRQVRLQEFGPAGQEKLRQASVLLVGAGGLGSAALPYLVGAGIGRIGIIDPDQVELSNLHRQPLYKAEDQGRSKAERAARFAQSLNPSCDVHAFPEPLTASNADRYVAAYDWIIDGTDSLQTKFLLNAACKLQGKTLVTASVHRFEGQIMTIAPEGPCLQCLFQEIPSDGCVGTCAETGILGVVPGLFGLLQATEVIKGILGLPDALANELLLLDLRTYATTRLRRNKVENCPGCRGEYTPPPAKIATMDSVEIENLEQAANLGNYELVDIRELYETPEIPIPHRRAPMSSYVHQPAEATVLVCAAGVRSLRLADHLREQGIEKVYSLAGGVKRHFNG